MLKPYDYTKNAGVNLLRKTGVSLLRKSGVSFDRRTGVSFIGISTLCPTNKNSFWCTTLDEQIVQKPKLAFDLVEKIKELYKTWNKNYCKGQKIEHVGLQDEPYFKYFDYADFLTPHSGLIQIEKYTKNEGLADMQNLFDEVKALTKQVKAEIYRLLVDEFKYFD